jgi:hypothetical protein
MANFITTGFLNLRSQPAIANGNVLGVMPPDTVVEQINGVAVPGWLQVKALLGGTMTEGFASGKYLKATQDPPDVQENPPAIEAVHYPLNGKIVSRNSVGLWPYPLNEPGLIKQDVNKVSDEAQRKTLIENVINFLDVEHSLRYAPNSKSTYCNIYAYDISYCLGAYLPRVWWTAEAILELSAGKKLEPKYDKTVTEITANRLTDWFEKYASSFGWQRTFNLDHLQTEINKGTLGIIVGQRINTNRSGHIVAIVPESPGHLAVRKNNLVVSPLQSQAGAVNRKYYTGRNWWEDATRFKKFGFWIWPL